MTKVDEVIDAIPLVLTDDQVTIIRKCHQALIRGRTDGRVGLTCTQHEAGAGKTVALEAAKAIAVADWLVAGEKAQIALCCSTTHLRNAAVEEFERYVASAIEEVYGFRVSTGIIRAAQDFINHPAARRLASAKEVSAEIRDAAAFLAEQPEGAEFAAAQQDYIDRIAEWPALHKGDVVMRRASPTLVDENRRAKNAELVYATHAMAIRMAVFGRMRPQQTDHLRFMGMPAIRGVIFDEADRLVQAGEETSIQSFFLGELYELIDQAEDVGIDVRRTRDLIRQIDQGIRQQVAGTGVKILAGSARANWTDRDNKDYLAELDPLVGELAKALDRIASKAARAESYHRGLVHTLLSCADDLEGFIDLLWPIGLSRARGRPFVAVDAYRGPYFGIAALEPARTIGRLWLDNSRQRAPDSIIFASATLEVPGENSMFMNFLRQVGVVSIKGSEANDPIVNTDLHTRFAHQHFGAARFVFPHPKIKPPMMREEDETGNYVSGEWREKFIIDMILEAAEASKAVFVHNASHEDRLIIGEILKPHLADRLIRHDRSTPMPVRIWEELIEAGVGPVLLSCREEGFNLHGIERIVVTRLPNRPVLPVDAALIAHFSPEDRSDIAARLQAFQARRYHGRTISRLYQIICRGLRRPDDEIVVYFGDSRIPLPHYSDFPLYQQRGKPHHAMYLKAIPVRFRDAFLTETLSDFKVFPSK